MKHYLITLIFFISYFSISHLFAQNTGDVRGFVYEDKSGEPVIFTPVYLTGTKYGAQTDVNGYFAITKVPPGKYTLVCSSLGMDTIKQEIEVKAGQLIEKKFHLKASSVELKAVDISAQKQEKQTKVGMSVTKITPKDMRQVPSVGGEPDLAQYLQVLPGVVFTGDQGGQLYIRGGTPIQNKVLLDGMIVYNPFHSIGFYSVFDADVIRNADVYTGGYNAQYGGRISSIMDITTRDGNKKTTKGKIGANTFGAKLNLEGPIKKAKSETDGSISYLISGKTSYMDKTSKTLYPFLDKLDSTFADSIGLPFKFNDIYAKLSFNAANGSKFNLFGFNFNDAVKYQGISNINWNSTGGGSSFLFLPGGSPILIKGNIAYSQYKVNFLEKGFAPRSSLINGFNMGIDFSYFLGKDELQYGMEVLGFKTNYEFTNSINREITQEQNTSEFASYMRYKVTAGKLLLEPGFRAHYYASLNAFSPEPRLGLKYNITDKIRLKASGGMYAQNLISGGSDRDVVNLFYGFLSGPEMSSLPAYKYGINRDSLFYKNAANRDSIPVSNALQKAIHYIAGFEFDLTKHLDLNIEAYHKQFTQVANVNRNKLFNDSPDNTSKPDYLKKDYVVETGYAQGVDILFKYEYKRLYIWTGYSFGISRRFDGNQLYYPVWDRRHNVNLVTSYRFGKNNDWGTDVRWNMGSGFPFTKTQGFYENISFNNALQTNYLTQNGTLGVQYAALGTGRLPYYHRLDISVKKEFVITENSILDITFSVTNAYNRPNIFYFDRVRFKRVNQLPLLPTIGVNWTF
ncbi:MAG: TonB-dependent receptor [Bacteroidia bacterium]|nr:TonB-dependent receptor [Bacteroidia bacterium]